MTDKQKPTFTPQDVEAITAHGITIEEAAEQIRLMQEGIPYPDILSSASLERGIVRLDKAEQSRYVTIWDNYLQMPDADPIKMVPASGAASRMFKDLYAFLAANYDEPTTQSEQLFFDRISRFSFYDLLNEACLRNEWKPIPKLVDAGRYKDIVRNLLLPSGINYGDLPKGLLRFHRARNMVRTAAEEHLVEAAMYARPLSGTVRLHFTTSPEHKAGFQSLLEEKKRTFEDEYCVRFDTTYSEQNPSTDTLATLADGSIARDTDGKPLFRPGGHGALIHNLNELKADVIFVKNIDNVVPDHFKCDTIIYKKLLGGILVSARKKVYEWLAKLCEGKASRSDLTSALVFLSDNFCIAIPDAETMTDETLQELICKKLDSPLRVCGMVKNEGEPGGGPFIIREPDGSTSLQILESSQIDMSKSTQRTLFEQGSFFNPVDLVCSIRRRDGSQYSLPNFVNAKTAFVSHKTKDGKPLIALERPGLWNGAMHHWLTIFVEVPLSTFNPVKTVNDLLRPEHQ